MRATWPLLGSNGPYSRVPLAAFLEAEVRLGLDGVDFVPQTPHFWCSHTGHESAAPLRAALAEAGLPVRVLTPPPYRYSLTAPPGRQREATLDYYRVCIALAAELGAGRLVLGAAGACWDIEPEALRRNAAGLLSALCPQAEAAGVRLLLAPVMGPETPLIAESPVLGRLEELSELLRRVDSPALGVCLDTNVMSTWGDSIPRWFERLGEHTGLVRLCDGNYHGWRAWGEGVLPMERYRAELEAAGKLTSVVTQNIDGLHQRAGSRRVWELHGSVLRNRCMACGRDYPVSAIADSQGVPRCSCGGIIKPDVVLYEESLSSRVLQGALSDIQQADMLIIGGTSLVVYPAAGLVNYYQGHRLVLINKSTTPYDKNADLVLSGPIGEILDQIKV